MTVVDWQKRCNEIAGLLSKEKEKNQTLIQDINNRQERFVKLNIQYLFFKKIKFFFFQICQKRDRI